MACNYSNDICRIAHYVQKIVHSHKPGKLGPAIDQATNNAAWHRRARFQLQREPLCALCLTEGKVVAARIADHIEPHHNDPIRFWNGKLQSLCARNATRAGRSSWRTAALTRQLALMTGRSIYDILSGRGSQYLVVISRKPSLTIGLRSMMLDLAVALAIGLVIGFILGYGVRALVSYQRHRRARRRSYLF
jgi:hypothetical protein